MKHVLVSILFAFSISAAATNGGEVRNGGDVVYCKPQKGFLHAGYYSLDFFFSTNSESEGLKAFGKDATFERIIQKIISLLELKDRNLAASLRSFASLAMKSDRQQNKIWIPAPYGLHALADENVVQVLPENCQHLENGKPGWIQTVQRETVGSKTFYHYDVGTIEKLSANPLQKSYLFVHEWLWDFTQDARSTRYVNQLLHSSDLESMSPNQFSFYLKDLGLHWSQSYTVLDTISFFPMISNKFNNDKEIVVPSGTTGVLAVRVYNGAFGSMSAVVKTDNGNEYHAEIHGHDGLLVVESPSTVQIVAAMGKVHTSLRIISQCERVLGIDSAQSLDQIESGGEAVRRLR